MTDAVCTSVMLHVEYEGVDQVLAGGDFSFQMSEKEAPALGGYKDATYCGMV